MYILFKRLKNNVSTLKFGHNWKYLKFSFCFSKSKALFYQCPSWNWLFLIYQRSCSNTSKIFLHFKSVYLRWVSLEAKTGIGILVQMTFWGVFEAEGEGKKKARTPGKNVGGSVGHQRQLIFRESLEHKSQNSIRCNLRPWGWPLQASLTPDSHWPEGNFPEEAVIGLVVTLKAAVGSKHSHWRRSRQGTNSIHYSMYIPCFLLVFYPHFCRWVLAC